MVFFQGVSNFNAYDLAALSAVATEPIEANEARFTVGAMDHDALAYMHANGIVPISYSSLSGGTDYPAVAAVAATHMITPEQVVYAYVSQHNITVVNKSPNDCTCMRSRVLACMLSLRSIVAVQLSTWNPDHIDWMKDDVEIFRVRLSADEMASLDKLQTSPRSCPLDSVLSALVWIHLRQRLCLAQVLAQTAGRMSAKGAQLH